MLLLKIKIKQNPSCQEKEYTAIFKHIHQNIRDNPRIQTKSALINDWESFAYWGEYEQSDQLVTRFGLFQIQKRGLGGVATSGKFCKFYLYLNLEIVFPAIKLTQNCYININISSS